MKAKNALKKLETLSEKNSDNIKKTQKKLALLQQIIKEHPEFSRQALNSFNAIISTPEFLNSLQTFAGNIFLNTVTNLSVMETIAVYNDLFQTRPDFALKITPALLKQKMQMSVPLFQKLMYRLSQAAPEEKNSYISPLTAAITYSPDKEAATMLDIAFSYPQLGQRMYKNLGLIYAMHPEMDNKIFSLLDDKEYLTRKNYSDFYKNLSAILTAATQNGNLIGIKKAVELLERHIDDTPNSTASLNNAYYAAEVIINGCPNYYDKANHIVRKGLKHPANTTETKKTALRLLGETHKIPTSISYYQRCEKSDDTLFGLKEINSIPANECCVLVLGGDGVEHTRSINGYLKHFHELLSKNGLADDVTIYGSVYDFGENMFLENARHQLFKEHNRRVDNKLILNKESINPSYIKNIFDNILLPRFSSHQGTRRLSFEEASQRIRRLTMFAHCHGAYTALKLEKMMQEKMQQLDYSKDERKQLQKQLLIVSQAPYCPLGISKSTFISFVSASDDRIKHFNTFEKAVRKLKRTQKIPLCYFPHSQGNLFLIDHIGSDIDEHNFWGLDKNKNMSRDGIHLIDLECNILLNGLKNALQEHPQIPTVEELVGPKNQKLLILAAENGAELWKQIQNAGKFMQQVSAPFKTSRRCR